MPTQTLHTHQYTYKNLHLTSSVSNFGQINIQCYWVGSLALTRRTFSYSVPFVTQKIVPVRYTIRHQDKEIFSLIKNLTHDVKSSLFKLTHQNRHSVMSRMPTSASVHISLHTNADYQQVGIFDTASKAWSFNAPRCDHAEAVLFLFLLQVAYKTWEI